MQNSVKYWTKVEAERQFFPPGTDRTRLIRSAWMAFYTLQGAWELSVPGKEYQVSVNDLVWIPTGYMVDQRYPQRTRTLTLRLRAGAWVPHAEGDRDAVVMREKLDRLVRRSGPVLPIQPATVKEVKPLLRSMVKTWNLPESPMHRGALKGGALYFFHLLSTDSKLAEELEMPDEPDTRQENRRQVAAALQLMNNRHYLETGTGKVEELASECGYKSSRFHTLFVQATGLTPNRYLTERRVGLACQLLADPERSVLDVAFGAGFGTQSRFYLAFKQITGMTPAEWRRKEG